MAIYPNPDRDVDFMIEEHGTKCLITDYNSENYLKKSKSNTSENRNLRWCGGKGGFDDFVERWH